MRLKESKSLMSDTLLELFIPEGRVFEDG